MCNCEGSKRAAPTVPRASALSAPPPPRPAGRAATGGATADAAAAGGPAVVMRYLGRAALLVRGPGSGRVYNLRPGQARIDCDPRDAPHFLASPLFERVDA